MNNNLATTNKNAKLALSKSKSLLDITNKLLSKKENTQLIKNFQFKPFMHKDKYTGTINSVVITPNGKHIVFGCENGTIKLYDMKSGKYIQTLCGHNHSIYSIAITPNGKYIVSGSRDETIKIWDMKSYECLQTLKGHTEWVTSISISIDGKYIISGGYQGTIKIWDIQSTKCLQSLNVPGRIQFIVHTPDLKKFFHGSWGGTISIYEVRKATCLDGQPVME